MDSDQRRKRPLDSNAETRNTVKTERTTIAPTGDCTQKSVFKDDRQALRIVLIGKTGSGKSSTGNTILGRDFFKSCYAASSETVKCQEARGTRFGKNLLLIETPGAFNTKIPNEEILSEMSKCIGLSLPGPHAFLLVLRAGRFTDEDHNTVKHISEMFGQDVFEHMILVLTGRDGLGAESRSFDEFLKTMPPSLKELLGKCGRRCVPVDRNSKNQSRETDARNLMEMINKLVGSHQGRYYTNEMLQDAERECRKKEEEIRRHIDEAKQKELDELTIQQNNEYQEKLKQQTVILNVQQQLLNDYRKREQELAGQSYASSRIKSKKRVEKRSINAAIQQCKEDIKTTEKEISELSTTGNDAQITKLQKSIDEKYLNRAIRSIQNLKVKTVFSYISKAALIGWGIVKAFGYYRR